MALERIFLSGGRDDRRGYRNMCEIEIPQGAKLE